MASREEKSDAFLDSDAFNDDFFISIVENKLKLSRDEFKLKLVLLSPATGKNENFSSVLYRTKLKIEKITTKERTSVNVIIKFLLPSMKRMLEYNVFPREIFVYDNFLRSFEKIWLEATDEEIQFGPRSIKFEANYNGIIVLDDLKAEGYEKMNRKIGLNKEQTKMLLTKLAKFHATSAIRYRKDGVIDKNLFDRKTIMKATSDENVCAESSFKMFHAFAKAVRDFGGYETYADKIDQWNTSKLVTQWVDVADPMECGFKVLNHGDVWVNNIMFKSNGKFQEALMIDYQCSFWASPSHDILYLLLLSVNDEIKVDCFDEFVEFYHIQLGDALRKLNYDQQIPSLQELHSDLLSKGSFVAICLFSVLIIFKYDSPEEMDMQTMMSGEGAEVIKKIFYNELYKKAVTLWLPFLDQRGFWDVLIKS